MKKLIAVLGVVGCLFGCGPEPESQKVDGVSNMIRVSDNVFLYRISVNKGSGNYEDNVYLLVDSTGALIDRGTTNSTRISSGKTS